MKRSMIAVLIVALMLFAGATAQAAIDLTSVGYSQVFLGDGNVTRIAFDYTFSNVNADDSYEFAIKGYYGGSGHYTMEMNFTNSDFLVDTDYGPYSVNNVAAFSGKHHYEFMLNSSNGLWSMSLDGVEQTFGATPDTTVPQPDGTTFTGGNKYFSDESSTAVANAASLGWTYNTSDENGPLGVGGVGDWKLVFAQAEGNEVSNITMGNVPEPTTIIIWSLLGGLGMVFAWRKRKSA
jgi:hypothetical protein